jgi:hypothetical protein
VDRLGQGQLVVFLHGIGGNRTPAMAKTIHAIPGARLAVIPAAGHLSNIEQPALFNRLILDFLLRVSAR